MKTKRSEEDLRLRRFLRRGDPAGGESLPAAQDLERMRRQILAQSGASEPSVPGLGLGWAAAFACVLVVVVVGWQLRDRSVPRPVASPVAELPADSPVPVPAPVVDVEEVTAAADPGTAGPELAVASADPDENLQTRTLYFTTRRGTQIIWILDPELEL